MRNRGSDENDTDLELYLFATSRSAATVTISNPNTSYRDTFTVSAGQRSTKIKIENLQAYIATPGQVENKGLQITADQPISLYAINYVQGSQDATYLYPSKGYTTNDTIHEFTRFVNRHYIVQTFNTDETATEFAIVATEDNTTVDIRLRESIFSGGDDYPDQPYSDTTVTVTDLAPLTMHKGQTYLYRASTANASLSGTSICSNKNIVVFQGGQHSLIPSYYYTPDNHIWSQASPAQLWGRQFVITRSGTQKADGVLITVAEDSTRLTIDTIGGVIDTTLNRLQTFDYYMRGKPYTYVQAGKAVECILYQTSYTYPETQAYGSPAMIPITPLENRFNSIIYATFEFHNPQITAADEKHYINIVTLTDGVSSMMMRSGTNGSAMGSPQPLSSYFTEVTGTDYSYAIIDVSDKGESHILYNDAQGFVAHAYGFGKTKGSYKESYGYSLGSNLLPSAWMLIDGERIDRKQICLNSTVDFTSVVNYDYTQPVQWAVHHHYSHERVGGDELQDLMSYAFPDTGHYDVYMIVNRPMPMCDNTLSDTVKASILVKDTFHIAPSLDLGNYRIICSKDRSDTLVAGQTYRYRADTMQVNQTYSYVDSLITHAGCDSIVYIDVYISPEYEHEKYDTVCVNDLPYSLTDQSKTSTITHDLDATDKATLVLPAENSYQTRLITATDTLQTIHGCDSIIHLELTVLPVYELHQYDTACLDSLNNYLWSNHAMTDVYDAGGKQLSAISLKHDGDYVYYDSLRTHGCRSCEQAQHCDSVWILHLKIFDRYVDATSSKICCDQSFFWEDTLWLGKDCDVPESGKYKRVLASDTILNHIFVRNNQFGCDSIIQLHLQIGEKYEVEHRDTICENEELVYEGTVYKDLTARDEPYPYDVLLQSSFGCDSLVHFYLQVYPSYSFTQDTIVCQDRTNDNWQWTDALGGLHILDEPVSIAQAGELHLVDSLSTQHGCDSIFAIHITIVPSYYFYDTVTICDNDTVHWQDSVIAGSRYSGDYALHLRDQLSAGVYDYSVMYPTAMYQCDSSYHLHLVIHPTYPAVAAADTTVVHMCDNESYHFHTATQDTVYNQSVRNWVTGDESIGRHVLTGVDTTVHGCDSAVAHVVYVYPAYEYWQDTTVCQNTIDTAWIWTDGFGNSHADRVPISLARAGDYVYADTLKRKNMCTDCGIAAGCDSVFNIRIHISPSYRFDSTYIICENEHTTWQGRKYAGDSTAIEKGEKMLTPGIYYDTAYYNTTEGCDSIYYLQLTVYPIYDTTTYVAICSNEDYVWRQSDGYGAYDDPVWEQHTDTVWLAVDQAGTQQSAKDDTHLYQERMLRSRHDCDSLSRLQVTVHPAYLFVSDTSICSSDRVQWRGKKYMMGGDTIIEERFTTAHGCDSVYQLRLHVMQSYLFRMYRQICDNETLYHINNTKVLWQPGQDIPEPEDCNGLVYQTQQGCDSLYCYFITVHPSYFFEDTIDFCSDDFYDPGTWMPAVDSLITDTFSTVYGCDSVYRMHATIYPKYKHVEYATICDNECFTWRGRTYCGANAAEDNPYAAGTHVFYDSLHTAHGCDSIYVLELTIHPTYSYDLHEAICDNDVYNFHGRIVSGSAGEYLYTDSLYSITGCDSVYNLFLTIYAATAEVVYDTLCVGDVYDFHGKPITQSGYYIDTTLNESGCMQVTELYLTVEDPTAVQLDYVSEFCDNENVIEIRYSYDGRVPISFSVLFDDFGHAQGFTDIISEPVTEQGVIHINIPRGDMLPNPVYNPLYLQTDGDTFRYVDTTHFDYPRPGKYHLSVFLQNGVCADDRIRVDTVFEMLFPSWIHEQHWNDAIVLFNEKYNGGYIFDDYQWYCDGEPIPGEVQAYIYDPQLLLFGKEYCANLHVISVKGQVADEWHFTCPITPTMMSDTMVTSTPYVAVVPTCLPEGLSGVDILCTEEGAHAYTVYNSEGLPLVTGGKFNADSEHQVHHAPIPQVPGVYVVNVITQSGYCRSVKVQRGCSLK